MNDDLLLLVFSIVLSIVAASVMTLLVWNW
jgi:hypothetical protein